MTPFIGKYLSKFVKTIEYTSDNVSLKIRDDIYPNNQFSFKIKQIQIGSSSKICGINIYSLLIDCIYSISTKPINQLLSTIIGILIVIFSIISAIFNAFFTCIYTIINFIFDKFFPNFKKNLLDFIDFNMKKLNINIESLFINVEIQKNDQNEKMNLKLSLEKLCLNFTKITDFDFNLKLEKLMIELINHSKNKTIINIELPSFEMSKKESIKFNIKVDPNITIYFSLLDINEIINIFNQFQIKNNIKNQNQNNFNNFEFNLNIPIIYFYIIKNNLPLLLLNIQTSTSLKFPFNNIENIIEIKMELKHLCHNTYKVIDRISTILTINESKVDIIVSPILITLPLFLFKELFSPEKNDSFHSKLENQYQNIFFQNNTGLRIELILTKKNNDNNNESNFTIQLNDDSPFKIKEEDYNQNILVIFNNKSYSFSISSLYSPIILDNDIVVSLNSENGINMIHFSSPYVIQNCLNYDIKVIPNFQTVVRIESGKNKYLPCAIDFDLTKRISMTKVSDRDFKVLDFKSSEPIQIVDNDFLIDSEPTNFYSTYFLSFESQKTICSINFFPYISITNFLPFEIKFKFLFTDWKELKPGVINDISYLKDHGNLILIYFLIEKFDVMGTFEIENLYSNCTKEIDLYKSYEKVGHIALNISEIKVDNKKFYMMKIYCPLIIENCSLIPLSIQVSKNINYQFIDDFIFYSSKSLMNHECLISLPIVYDDLTIPSSTKYEYVGNFSQIIPLQHKLNDKIFFLLLIEKQKNENENSLKIPSAIISIKPYLKVHSDVNETIIFSAKYTHKHSSQEYKNICNKGDSVIFGSNEKGFFDIYVKGYQKCRAFNMFSLGSSVIRLDKLSHTNKVLLFKLVVKKEDNGYCCYVSYPSISSDITIENCIQNNCVCIRQQHQPKINDFEFHSLIIHPNEKVIYAKEQPFLYEELESKYNCVVSIGTDFDKYLISYEESCHSRRIGETNYFYDVKKIDRDNRAIVIYKSSRINDEDQLNKNDSLSKMNFSIRLTEIQASFIDNEMHEIFLIAAKNIILNINEKIKFSIEGLALNDMYSATLSPVVLNGKEHPFLNVEITSKYPLKMLMFEDITIKIAPIQVFIDFQFVGDLIAIMKEIAICFSQFKINSKLNLFCIFSTKKFTIKNVSICATPACSITRKYRFKHNDDFYLSFFKIPFSKVVSIDFKEINKFNIEAPLIDFLKSVPDCYRKQFTLSKGLFVLAKFVLVKPKQSKFFSDYVEFKDYIFTDLNLEIPRRLPRVFPNGKIYDVPARLTDDYPDLPTLFQFLLQRFSGYKYTNNQLKELFFNKIEKTWLLIFDHLLVFYKNDIDSIVTFNEIKSIEIDSIFLTIKYSGKSIYFMCQNEDDAKSIINKINFFMQKIKISTKYYS